MSYDFTSLPDWLVKPRSAIVGDRLPVADGRGVLIFRDYGADVLLVAHTDWVGEPANGAVADRPRVRNGSRIAHPALDDRLGCWAIEQLWANGVKADLLFTDCEEIGWSTADAFVPPREYKFALMFDRAGCDAVLYQYEHAKAWRKYVGRHIGPIGCGSYSCISSMTDLGFCGVNIGIGYYEHNGPRCWADLRLSTAQMDRATCFIGRARHRPWKYEPRVTLPPRVLGYAVGGDGLAYVTKYRGGRRSAAVLAEPYDKWPIATAARLCVACSYAADDAHHDCPMVADCYCCAATDEREMRYEYAIR